MESILNILKTKNQASQLYKFKLTNQISEKINLIIIKIPWKDQMIKKQSKIRIVKT